MSSSPWSKVCHLSFVICSEQLLLLQPQNQQTTRPKSPEDALEMALAAAVRCGEVVAVGCALRISINSKLFWPQSNKGSTLSSKTLTFDTVRLGRKRFPFFFFTHSNFCFFSSICCSLKFSHVLSHSLRFFQVLLNFFEGNFLFTQLSSTNRLRGISVHPVTHKMIMVSFSLAWSIILLSWIGGKCFCLFHWITMT